jgi:hypothetical protein
MAVGARERTRNGKGREWECKRENKRMGMAEQGMT